MSPITDVIGQLKNRDHLAVVFDDDSQLEQIITGFANRGLKYNQTNVFFVYGGEEAKYREYISKSGIGPESSADERDAVIVLNDKLSDERGVPSFENIARELSVVKESAVKRGKTGLNIAGTIGGRLLLQENYNHCIYLENRCEELVSSFDFPLTVLCLYSSAVSRIAQDLLGRYHNRGVRRAGSVDSAVCQSCGKSFSVAELSEEQIRFYGETICRECFGDRVHPYAAHENVANKKPRLLPQEEHLSAVSQNDVRVMNARIKNMINKRDTLLEALEGKAIQTTILCTDIVNSTLIAKKLTSDQVGEYYRTFLEAIGYMIMKYGGYVLKNVGDCVIGFFPSGMHVIENHDKAALCGLSVFDMIRDQINPYLAQKKLPPIEARVSADFGSTEVVRVGPTERYPAIDLFGNVINSATKIKRFAKPGQMVVGDDLFWKLKDFDFFAFSIVKKIDISGKYMYPVYIVRTKQH